MLSPCVKPMRRVPCVTTLDRAVGIGKLLSDAAGAPCPCAPEAAELEVRGMSKSPFTNWRSGAS